MAKREGPAGSGHRVTEKSLAAGKANMAKGRETKRKKREAAIAAGQPKASDRWAMLLDGRLTVQDLDDDEIDKMRVRGADGGFSGRRHAIPSHLAQQWKQEAIRRATEQFHNATPKAVKRLIEIANDEDTKTGDAIRALQLVLERGLGKVPDTVRIEGQTPWDAALRDALPVDRNLVDDPRGAGEPLDGQGR